MGSLVIKNSLLPTGLDHTRNLAIQGELAEAQAADAELAQEAARPPAAPAAVAVAAAQLGSFLLLGLGQFYILGDLGGCSHSCEFSYCRNGIPMLRSKDSPSASVRAVVVIEIFIPLVLSTLA